MDKHTNDPLGGRLPLHEPSTITGSQRAMYDSMVEDYAAWAKQAGFKMATLDGRLIGPLVGPSSLYWAPGAEGRMAYVTTDGGLLAPGPDGIVHPPALLRFTIEEGTCPRS